MNDDDDAYLPRDFKSGSVRWWLRARMWLIARLAGDSIAVIINFKFNEHEGRLDTDALLCCMVNTHNIRLGLPTPLMNEIEKEMGPSRRVH